MIITDLPTPAHPPPARRRQVTVPQADMLIPPPPPIQHTPSTATATGTFSFEAKRTLRSRELQFDYKYGHRHHTYEIEKAPYPLSYDKEVLELESLDNALIRHIRGSPSFINFAQSPTRVLDLGCGLGTWVIEAAKHWSDCEFVGFDLVNIQIPMNPKVVDPSLASRITWKHGNFLTTKLPFDDDEFDFVHVRSITRGVPENKWDVLLEEINRVLAPGGVVEVIEEDTIFPVLPRWFTRALRSRSREGSNETNTKDGSEGHDHALLEYLMNSIFEGRFINTKPTAILPSYFSTYFRQVSISPVVTFPMPVLAPLVPIPPQVVTNYVIEPNSNAHVLEKRTSTFNPSVTIGNRPASHSFSSASTAAESAVSSAKSSIHSKRPRTASGTLSSSPRIRSFSLTNATTPSPPSPEDDAEQDRDKEPPEPQVKYFIMERDANVREAHTPGPLFPEDRLSNLSERSLAMHLYHSFQLVLSCQESMFEELKRLLRKDEIKEELVALGWGNDSELEGLEMRQRWEKLIARFKSDMHVRIALWSSLTGFGWPIPSREPLTKAEILEEECVREAMFKVSQLVSSEEVQTPCRSVRVLIGHKV